MASRYNGKMGPGAKATIKEQKRAEAEARQAAHKASKVEEPVASQGSEEPVAEAVEDRPKRKIRAKDLKASTQK